MDLDIDKILDTPKEEIEPKEFKRLQELGILSSKIDNQYALGENDVGCSVYKYKYEEQVFFIFKGFYLDQKSDRNNHINLEKYLQSDEFNIILLLFYTANNLKTIENLNEIKRKVIIINSSLPNISSCKFENKVFLHYIRNNSTFGGCEFTKEVYVDGYAFFQACTFSGDFISQNSGQDISFASSTFNKSFKLGTKNELGEVKFEATCFKQKFIMDIGKFSVLDFSSAEFDCELNLHAKQFDGININFTNAKFNQKLSFHRSIINCEMLFKEARFESDLIFTETKFNDVVNLDKAKFKGKAQFHGTKFNRVILTETNFENKADFSNAVFNEKAYFTNAIFKADTDFGSTTFTDEARFFNAKFKDTTTFEKANFKSEANFTDAVFEKETKLNNILFNDKVYFQNALFKDIVDFGETNFERNAYFYNADFKNLTNFASSVFDGTLNFTNVKTNFTYLTYEELKNIIKDKSTNDMYPKNHKINHIDKCINITNDFRDGFRLIKHTLSDKGNALDASLYRCLELYCKELELEFTLEKTKDKNSKNDKEIKSADKEEAKPKSKNRIEVLLDLITLKLYRNTSDHHTNLLRIINFMALTIAAYGLCFYIFDIFLLEAIVANPKALVLSIILCYIAGLIAYMDLGIKESAVAVIATLICVFYSISKYYPIFTIDFILLYLVLYYIFFYLHKFRLAKILTYLICIFIFLSKPTLLAPFIGVFTSEQAAQSKFKEYAARYNENGLDDMLLDANLTNAKKDDKLDFIVKNRKMILEELECEKTLLINSKNKCAQNTDEIAYSNPNSKKQEITKKPYAKALNALKYDEIMQSTQKSANLLYSFIMLLVVYSLTKTARRNSLVPN